jgi:drug/metabolite transporter (DMT)-like permease
MLSAATFGTSGTFAASLIGAGWSPAAAVCARIAVAALILTVPALIQLRGRWAGLRRNAAGVAAYGLIAVAGCQLFYFNAVARMPVGVALLLEYLGAVLVVGWLWVRHGQRPRRLTVTGAVTAIAGLVLVLNLTGSARINLAGLVWGLLAAVGLAIYFLLSAGLGSARSGRPGAGEPGRAGAGDAAGAAPGAAARGAAARGAAAPGAAAPGAAAPGAAGPGAAGPGAAGPGAAGPGAAALPPIVMAWAGMCVGAVTLGVLGWAGLLPMTATTRQVDFLGHRVSWLVPVLGLSVIAAVISYVAGIGAARRLGAKLASFIGMSEVLFAILFAWLLLGQLPTVLQFLGGAFILAGVTLVRLDELHGPGDVVQEGERRRRRRPAPGEQRPVKALAGGPFRLYGRSDGLEDGLLPAEQIGGVPSGAVQQGEL